MRDGDGAGAFGAAKTSLKLFI